MVVTASEFRPSPPHDPWFGQYMRATPRGRAGNVERTRRVMLVLAAMALIASACTGGDPERGNSTGNPADPDLPRGGTLRVIIPVQRGASRLTGGPALDPQKDWWSDSFALFRCCLLRTLLAHPGLPTEEGGSELHPDLAAEMPEISGDGLAISAQLQVATSVEPGSARYQCTRQSWAEGRTPVLGSTGRPSEDSRQKRLWYRMLGCLRSRPLVAACRRIPTRC